MGHNPAGPKSVSISVCVTAAFLSHAFSHSFFISSSQFAYGQCYFLRITVPFLLDFTSVVSQQLKFGQSRCKAQLCLRTVLSYRLRACSDFVIVLKLQTRAAPAGIPDKLPMHHIQVNHVFFFQTQRNNGEYSMYHC